MRLANPYIIWDWNGTLIDDVTLGVEVMNGMLQKRGLETITIDIYKNIFGFPVRNYYTQLGFNVEDEWEVVAHEFIRGYHARIAEIPLAAGATEMLNYFNAMGCRQSILSAMEHETLNRHVASFGISSVFDNIYGIGDHYADSKVRRGKELFDVLAIEPRSAIFIGDTLHDRETARSLGCGCMLVAAGHQSKQRLMKYEEIVVERLEELRNYIY